ncbi:MAG: PD40 domain-containing protein [Candidatus Riflebacteria bacterium]|nr:PD40 domain-containing protein [Candidatus Riflebacteria bacterium]
MMVGFGDGSSASSPGWFGGVAAYDPDWSPDGSELLCAAKNGTANTQIHAATSSGGSVERITYYESAGESYPRASPDGQFVAIHSTRDGNSDVWIVRADGTYPFNVTRHPSGEKLPSWSPDGNWLAFESNRTGTWGIWVVRRDGSDARMLATPGSSPRWSPDGSHIAFSLSHPGELRADNEICIVRVNGGGLRKVTSNGFTDGGPSWTPDGGALLYTSTGGTQTPPRIVRLSVNGGSPTPLSAPAGNEADFWPTLQPVGPPPNRVPVIDVGPVRTWGTGRTGVNLVATAYDPDDDPMTYAWTQVGGTPGALTITEATNCVASLGTPSQPGSYVVSFAATDSRGGSFGSTVAVAIVASPPANRAPTVHVPRPGWFNATVGETVKLEAWASDPDGDPLAVSWRQTWPQRPIFDPPAVTLTWADTSTGQRRDAADHGGDAARDCEAGGGGADCVLDRRYGCRTASPRAI